MTNLAALAERSLKAGRPVDYDLPFRGVPPLRSAVVLRFHQLCVRGDHRACWIEAQYSTARLSTGDYTRVADNCRAGDRLSCRALPIPGPGLPAYPDLPGAMGRGVECQTPASERCDEELLHRECAEGFRNSCLSIPYDEEHAEAQHAAFKHLADEDCGHDIASGCVRPEGSLEARVCELTDECFELGLSLESHDALGARNALERACQYDQSQFVCATLAAHYIHHEWPEPVPGRGLALMKWACPPDTILNVCEELQRQTTEPGE